MGKYILPRGSSFEDRLWAYVQKSSGCWLWTGARSRLGYGVIKKDGRSVFAHRAVWESFHKQPIPDGAFACHRCNSPWCVNPKHVYVGTPADNTRDKIAAGSSTTIDWTRAQEIVNAGFKSANQLAKQLGCSATGVEKAIKRGVLTVPPRRYLRKRAPTRSIA